jgi:hypothetical protein
MSDANNPIVHLNNLKIAAADRLTQRFLLLFNDSPAIPNFNFLLLRGGYTIEQLAVSLEVVAGSGPVPADRAAVVFMEELADSEASSLELFIEDGYITGSEGFTLPGDAVPSVPTVVGLPPIPQPKSVHATKAPVKSKAKSQAKQKAA